MLSKEDNELLTKVSAGTPMGEVMRHYWLPLLVSSELPEPDGHPIRVRILGEDLVAFRDTNGLVGLLEEHCAHRGSPLYFGRNEDCGLRCVYHGWKFDRNGQCVDMPNEPPESTFKDRVKIASYPCVERNGVIWTFMGQGEPPELPSLEWNLVPENQYYISKRYEECNWAQALEGGIDSSHSSFLHSHLNSSDYRGDRSERGMKYKTIDRHPLFETVDTSYGMMIAARRDAGEENFYWRITQFLMPFYTMLPPYGPDPLLSGHAWVPIDDEHTMAWTVTWHPTRALREEELASMKYWEPSQVNGGLHLPLNMLDNENFMDPGSKWKAKANKENSYLIDWDLQKNALFSGIPTIALQDQAMQEGMGFIYDRTKEHLGTADVGIIRVRRLWLNAAKAWREYQVIPRGAANPETYYVRSTAVVLGKDADWAEETADRVRATPGVNFDAA